ncbi:hypothetical protein ACFL2V_12645 [Pseudomonadota bacterium]
MLEKGSSIHKGAVNFAHTVLGCSKVESLKTENALLSIALVEKRYNPSEALEKARARKEELAIEIEIAKMRQGIWGRLQEKVGHEHYIWCN